ncbi:hypothetical protein U1Q18_019085 [Sarracenia purpurea var. burkii]
MGGTAVIKFSSSSTNGDKFSSSSTNGDKFSSSSTDGDDGLGGKQEFFDARASLKAASPKVSRAVVTSSIKKPLGAKKTGGLGARKLTTKMSESFYNQKPEEPPVQVSTSSNSTPTTGSSLQKFSSSNAIIYVDDVIDDSWDIDVVMAIYVG